MRSARIDPCLSVSFAACEGLARSPRSMPRKGLGNIQACMQLVAQLEYKMNML